MESAPPPAAAKAREICSTQVASAAQIDSSSRKPWSTEKDSTGAHEQRLPNAPQAAIRSWRRERNASSACRVCETKTSRCSGSAEVVPPPADPTGDVRATDRGANAARIGGGTTGRSDGGRSTTSSTPAARAAAGSRRRRCSRSAARVSHAAYASRRCRSSSAFLAPTYAPRNSWRACSAAADRRIPWEDRAAAASAEARTSSAAAAWSKGNTVTAS